MTIGIDARLVHETGVGRYIKNLLRHLSEVDKVNSYTVFVKSKDLAYTNELVSGAQWNIVSADHHWHSVSEQIGFNRILMKQNLDLMHFPYFSLPIMYTRPFVVTIHDLIIHHFPTGKASTLPFPLYHIKHLGYRAVLSQAISRSKGIIVPLESVKKDVIKTFHVSEKKVFVTKEGFDRTIQEDDVSESVKNLTDNSSYFLYVGNAYPHKNLEVLINAFLSYTWNTKCTSLLLVGKDDYFYKRLQKKYTSPAISFLHAITDGDLGYLYTHAQSLVSVSRMEGFGLTALEAMALSCPVILSDIPAFREVCDNAAIYVNPDDVAAVQQGFMKIQTMKNEDKKELQLRGKERVELFSWKKMAEETLAVYERCAGL